MPRLPLVVDTDCGIDDALALFVLAGSREEVDLRAVTCVYGTAAVDDVTWNVLTILSVAGMTDLPVYRGAGQPLLYEPRYSPHVHGTNGLGDVPRPLDLPEPRAESAVDYYLRLLPESGERVTVLALGPLTNLAIALAARPSLVGNVERIVAMGGAAWVPGNTTPMAESNIAKDPEAAAIVLGSGVPLTLVPLDVTRQVVLTRERLESLAETESPAARFAARIAPRYVEFHRQSAGLDGMYLHDPVAAIYLLRPDLFETSEEYLEIDTRGPYTLGKVLAHPTRPIGRGHRGFLTLGVQAEPVEMLIEERLVRTGGRTSAE